MRRKENIPRLHAHYSFIQLQLLYLSKQHGKRMIVSLKLLTHNTRDTSAVNFTQFLIASIKPHHLSMFRADDFRWKPQSMRLIMSVGSRLKESPYNHDKTEHERGSNMERLSMRHFSFPRFPVVQGVIYGYLRTERDAWRRNADCSHSGDCEEVRFPG